VAGLGRALRRLGVGRSAETPSKPFEEDASKGIELFDMAADPHQYTNLASRPEYAGVVAEFQPRLVEKLTSLQDNDL
jgi:hypothetical protein